MVIGGKDVTTGDLRPAVMPHDKAHVLADVHQGRPSTFSWRSMPPRRPGATGRAGRGRTAPRCCCARPSCSRALARHAERGHDARPVEDGPPGGDRRRLRVIDFFRWNVEFMTRIYAEQPVSPPGIWNRLEYRPLEGFVFAVSPFNFTAIGANLTSSPALLGNTVVWKPASTAMLSAYYVMRLFQEAGLPDGVINLVYGSGATIGDAALASPDLAGIHFTGSTAVFHGMWRTVAVTSRTTATTRGSSARRAARTSSSPTRPPTSTRSRRRSSAARSSTRARSAPRRRASTRRRTCGPP